ncbi:hypothetical protein ACLOJK_037243 [Asimina triloba]
MPERRERKGARTRPAFKTLVLQRSPRIRALLTDRTLFSRKKQIVCDSFTWFLLWYSVVPEQQIDIRCWFSFECFGEFLERRLLLLQTSTLLSDFPSAFAILAVKESVR